MTLVADMPRQQMQQSGGTVLPRPNVLFIHRKRRPNANYSLEAIFDDVRQRLKDRIVSDVFVAPFFSNGLFRRLSIVIAAWWCRSPLNHVTGDINFAGLLISPNRVILTIPDCGFLDRTTGWRRVLLQWFWVTLPVRRAGMVTTISEAAKRDIVRYSGCDPQRVRVIPVAISQRFRPFAARPFPAIPRILQIGTAPNKNVSRVIESLSGVACVLVIVGELHRELKQLSDQFDVRLENYVNLSEDQIVEQYRLCDLVVFASTLEGFGMPILEAQAVGRPVITSNLSSMPEVAGDAACFVDPLSVASIREGIERVMGDPLYRETLVESGYVNVTRFDPQLIADQYFDVYDEMMHRRG